MSKKKKKGGAPCNSMLVVLCGLPGCGKSTLTKEIERKSGGKFVRISQDDLGTVPECKKLLEKALKKKQHAIIDRCNPNTGDRKMWINHAKRQKLAPPKNTYCVHFDIPKEICIKRAEARKKHPTLGPENAKQVINDFSRGFRKPEKWEGPWQEVITIKNDADAKAAVEQILALI